MIAEIQNLGDLNKIPLPGLLLVKEKTLPWQRFLGVLWSEGSQVQCDLLRWLKNTAFFSTNVNYKDTFTVHMTAKTPLTRGKSSDASQAMWPRGNMKQSTFGKRPGWTNFQQCLQRLSGSSSY